MKYNICIIISNKGINIVHTSLFSFAGSFLEVFTFSDCTANDISLSFLIIFVHSNIFFVLNGNVLVCIIETGLSASLLIIRLIPNLYQGVFFKYSFIIVRYVVPLILVSFVK